MDTELQFDQVSQSAAACGQCQSALRGSYFQANGQVLCAECAEHVRNLFQSKNGGFGRFAKATGLGIAGGVAGAAVYTAVLALVHINAALITILIGWLVGKGVSRGCSGRGGIGYQLLAVVITYAAIGFSATLADVLTSDIAQGSALGAVLICIIGTVIGGVLVATSGFLGALITFFGLWQAWQSNKAVKIEVTGPHALGAVSISKPESILPLPANGSSLPQSA